MEFMLQQEQFMTHEAKYKSGGTDSMAGVVLM